MKKRIGALLLTLAMVVTFMPAMTLTTFAGLYDKWDADFYIYPAEGTFSRTPSNYEWQREKGRYHREIEDLNWNVTLKASDNLPDVTPTREGYVFKEWLFTNDKDEQYEPITDSSVVKKSDNKGYFKPSWTRVYKITLKDGNSTFDTIYRKSGDSETYYSDATCETPLEDGKITVPSDEDKTFEGFFEKDHAPWGNKSVKADGTVLPGLGDVTLHAKWHDKLLEGIEVTTEPDKTDYVAGEKFDATGMEVTATYDNGTTEVLSAEDYTVEPERLFVEDKEVTITYNGETATQPVSVTAPVVIEGKDQKVTEGTKKAVTFTSNAPFATFDKVLLNGEELDPIYYEAVAGSTEVTLRSDYVSLLRAGNYTVSIVSTGGTAEGTLTVVPEEKKDTGVTTGDSDNMMLYLLLGLGAACAALFTYKRREN